MIFLKIFNLQYKNNHTYSKKINGGKVMEDISKLRQKHWEEFVNEYIAEAKKIEFPKIVAKEGYNNYKIIRINSGKKVTPNMFELNFICEIVKAQERKKKLLPYIWVWALSGYTANISDYCRKKLYNTLIANGFEKYVGAEKSIKLGDDEFDLKLKNKLSDVNLTGKKYANILKEFLEDYIVISEEVE